MDIQTIVIYFSEDPAEPLFQVLRGLFPVCDHCTEPGLTILVPAPGVIIQLLSTGAQPPHFLTGEGPVICYAVTNLAKAEDEAIRQGAELLYSNTDPCTGFSFSYLRQKKIFGLFATRRSPDRDN